MVDVGGGGGGSKLDQSRVINVVGCIVNQPVED